MYLIIPYLFFFTPIIVLLVVLWKSYGKDKIQEESEEEHADTDIVAIPYRGESISMTWIEYLNGWKYMNRVQKNVVYDNQMQKLKKGIITKRYVSDNEYVIEATKRSSKSLKNQKTLTDIYKTGV